MSLAYLLALISRARRLALTDLPGDIWSTGELLRQHGGDTRFLLRPVAHDGFQKKLEAFLAPDTPDTLLIAPFANIADRYDALSRQVNVLRVTKGRPLAPEQLRSLKTVALVDETELQQLLDLLFIAPAGQQPKPQTQTRLRRPSTYTTCPRYDYFVGRDDLKRQVIAELRGSEKVTCMVNDIGGIGKTALASEIVAAIGAEFAGVYYTKCTPDTDADALLAELAYFLAEHGDSTVAEVFEYAAQQWPKINALIAALNARRYLLLFDDLHDTLNKATCEILRPDLKTFFDDIVTQAHQSKLFFISRTQPIIPSGQARHAKHKLGPLDREAGITLLRHCGVQAAPELLERAYEFTKGHPVSMKLLATLTETMPLRTILADHQYFWNAPEVANDLLRRIYQTTMADEQNVLFQMAVLPHPVTNAVIYALDGRPETPQLLKNLVRKSLVLYDPQNELYRLHDVIRDFQREQLTAEQKQAYHLKAAAYYERQEFNADWPTFEQVQNRLEARYHYFQVKKYDEAAKLFLGILEFYRTWGYIQQSKTLIEETLSSIKCNSPTNGRLLLQVDLFIELSYIEMFTKSFDKAIERCKQAEDILKVIRDEKLIGKLYQSMGKIFYEKSDWVEANNYFTRSFEIRKKIGDTKGLSELLKSSRIFYTRLGEFEKVESISKESLEICDQHGDIENTSEILLNVLGASLRGQHRFDEALMIYEQSLSKTVDNPIIASLSLRLIGESFLLKKNYVLAHRKFGESLTHAIESKNIMAQAYALQGIGNTYRDEQKRFDAIKKYKEAMNLLSQLTDISGKASVLHNISTSFRDIGEIDSAIKCIEEALIIKEKENDLFGIADCFDAIGNIYATRYSDFNRAIMYYKQCLELKERLGQLQAVEYQMARLATDIYVDLGKLDEALNILEAVLKVLLWRNGKECQILI